MYISKKLQGLVEELVQLEARVAASNHSIFEFEKKLTQAQQEVEDATKARWRTLNQIVNLATENLKAQTPSVNLEPTLSRPIEDLEMMRRINNCLKGSNIYYIGDLVQWTLEDLLRAPNLGSKSVNEIREVLSSRGLSLGTKIPSWKRPDDTLAK